jgi:uncharacterized protein DUF4838
VNKNQSMGKTFFQENQLSATKPLQKGNTMKKVASFHLLILIIGLTFAMFCNQALAKNQEKSLPLVKNGKPLAVIVVAEKPATVSRFIRGTVEFAAQTLQDYIIQSTGVKLPIRKDSDNLSGTLILVGKTNLEKIYKIRPEKLPPEGYVIKSFPKGIAIIGDIEPNGIDRGTCFGVYRFLEDQLGIRWYFPGEMGTVVPKHKQLIVPKNYTVSGKPYFKYRIGGIGHWQKKQARNWHPVLRFGSSKGVGANHSMEGWARLYGKTHPEYFGLRKDGTRAITLRRVGSGQNQSFICFSEPGVLKQHLDNVDDYYATGKKRSWSCRPRGNWIPFSPHDTRKYCVCDKCKKLLTVGPDRKRWGATSDVVFDFVSKYGKGVKAKHPEAIISAMAYDHYQLAPYKIKHLPDNIAITLCLIPTWIQMSHPGVQKRNDKLTEKWFNLVNRNPERLIIWDYFCYPNCFFLAPTEIPHILKRNINNLKGKALGVFNNGFNPRTKAGNPRLYLTFRIVWLLHKLLWNPDLDLDKARYDWCHDLFGPGGAKMEEFYKLLEDRWEKTTWKTQPKVGYIGEYGIFFETYPPDVTTKLIQLYNEAILNTKSGSIYRKRLEWFKKKAYGPFFKKAAEYHMATGAVAQYKVKALKVPAIKSGLINQAAWAKISAADTVDRVFGKTFPEENKIKIAYDKKFLYIYAKMEVTEKSLIVKRKAKDKDKQAAFQFGAGGNSKKSAKKLLHAKATGIENPKVSNDDMFIIYLNNSGKGYVELAINPNGSFSTKADVIKKRGFFPSHNLMNIDSKGFKIISQFSGKYWFLQVALPWQVLPGVKTVPPTELRAQFLRWNVKDKHHFSCWSPPLSSWDFPLSRFGRLIFKDMKGKLQDIIIKSDASQTAYMGGFEKKPKQPTKAMSVKLGKAVIVGQRDMGKNHLDLRGFAIFNLPPVAKDKVYRATYSITLKSTVGVEPFDKILLEHFIPVDTSKVSLQDFNSKGQVTGQLLPAITIRKNFKTPKVISLDVTEWVKKDIAAKRKVSAFRMRISNGCTANDKKIHFLVFEGKKDKKNGPELKIQTIK